MAVKEINGQTDIRFDYEEIKTGRKITSLKFNIFKDNSKRKEEVQIESKQKGSESGQTHEWTFC